MDQSGDLDGLIRNDTLPYCGIKDIKNLIKKANDPELVEPLNTIFYLYEKAYQLTPRSYLQQSIGPFFVMKNEEQEIVIQSLQKISRQFKEKTADDKCHDLFILMMINTYFSVRDMNNITHDSYGSLSIFFNLINYYFNPHLFTKDSSNIDFDLVPNFTTFMACQLYLGQLLTPVYSRQCTYMSPKFDDFWKNTSLDPAKSKPSGIISRYIDLFSITNPNGFGSNLYRSVLSPIQGMVHLFPDYVPLLCKISLSDTLILKYAPDDENNLWLVGCPNKSTGTDGGYLPPNIFIRMIYFTYRYVDRLHTY